MSSPSSFGGTRRWSSTLSIPTARPSGRDGERGESPAASQPRSWLGCDGKSVVGAGHSAPDQSLLVMVPSPNPLLAIEAFVGFARFTENVSFASTALSPTTCTTICLDASPGPNVSVPFVAR